MQFKIHDDHKQGGVDDGVTKNALQTSVGVMSLQIHNLFAHFMGGLGLFQGCGKRQLQIVAVDLMLLVDHNICAKRRIVMRINYVHVNRCERQAGRQTI